MYILYYKLDEKIFNKIVATVGTACENEDMLKSMIKSSLASFRIDFTDYNVMRF